VPLLRAELVEVEDMAPKPTRITKGKKQAKQMARSSQWRVAAMLALGAILVTSTIWAALPSMGRQSSTPTPPPIVAKGSPPTTVYEPPTVLRSETVPSVVGATALPSALPAISPALSPTIYSLATSTQTPSATPLATQTPTAQVTCTPVPTRSPTQPTQAAQAHTVTPSSAQITITIEGLDDAGLACSSLLFFMGDALVRQVALSEASDPRHVVIPGGSADWLRFEGGTDGQCPWANWNMADADPNRVPIAGEVVALRFVLIPDEPRPT
jgi:hypothetical protein